jgi:hypothetical protein
MQPSVLGRIDRLLGAVRNLVKATEAETTGNCYLDAYAAFQNDCRGMEDVSAYLKDIRYPDAEAVDPVGVEKSPFRYQKPAGGRASELLRFLHELEQSLLKARSAVSSDEQERPADDSEDAPVAPDGFRYCGKVYSPLARGPFRALSVVWESENRCVNREDLAEAIYGDREEELEENTLRGLRSELNGFFRAHHVPYKATVRGYSIAIKEGNPPAAGSAKQSRPGRKKKTRR